MEKKSNTCGRGLLSYTPHGDEERLRACYMETIETLTFGLDPACPSSSLGTHILQHSCNPRIQQEVPRTKGHSTSITARATTAVPLNSWLRQSPHKGLGLFRPNIPSFLHPLATIRSGT